MGCCCSSSRWAIRCCSRGRAAACWRASRRGPSASDLSTTTYVIIASAQVLALFSFWTPSGVIWWQAQGALFWILTTLYAASWLLLGQAILDAGITLQTGSLGWWAVFRNARPAFPGMPTRGLFRLCRQPIYLAFTCTVWTVPVWTPDQLLIAIGLTAYCLVGPLFKEARFARQFGQEFTDLSENPSLLATDWGVSRAETISRSMMLTRITGGMGRSAGCELCRIWFPPVSRILTALRSGAARPCSTSAVVAASWRRRSRNEVLL